MYRFNFLTGPLLFANALLAIAVPSWAGEPISLALPVACNVGQTCFVQNYFDSDPSPQSHDYMCGDRTYQGHDGTDFRIPSLEMQRAGVDVLAAAPGTVIATRDGMADISIRDPAAGTIKGRECGNGIMIRHFDGWMTQYCHMARGSIRVTRGERVETGTPLGRVGLSGNTEFPHLHFNVFAKQSKIDPFAYEAKPGSCGGGKSLWDGPTGASLRYRRGLVINAGFAAEAVNNTQVEADDGRHHPLTTSSPALVAYVRSIGLEAGDVLELLVNAPDGSVFVERRERPLDRPKAQWLMIAGRQRKTAPWPTGLYTARYRVLRESRTALERTFTVNLAEPQ